MSDIKFSRDEMSVLVPKIKRYFEDELSQEIGGFEAEFLIEFFAKELGSVFYNRGIQDAQVMLIKKVDELSDEFYQLEKPSLF